MYVYMSKVRIEAMSNNDKVWLFFKRMNDIVDSLKGGGGKQKQSKY